MLRVYARVRTGLSRIAGRLVTGPVAFLVAGLIDVAAAWAQWLAADARRRWRRLARWP